MVFPDPLVPRSPTCSPSRRENAGTSTTASVPPSGFGNDFFNSRTWRSNGLPLPPVRGRELSRDEEKALPDSIDESGRTAP